MITNWPEGAAKYKDGKFYTLSGRIVGTAAVANDRALSNEEMFSPEVKAKIAKAKRKVGLDAAADRKVKALFPFLQIAVAADNADEEQAAQGSFSSQDEDGNEATDEDNTFGAEYAASLKATKEYWDNVRRIKPSATYQAVRERNKTAAVDYVATNAKKAKSYSMFDTAKAIIKRQKKSA